jgi:hypothetical protein
VQTDEAARGTWLRHFIDADINIQSVDIDTRAAYEHKPTASTIYPDVAITGSLSTGDEFVCLIEHKWQSPCSLQQLQQYAHLMNSENRKRYLGFVCASGQDLRAARNFPCDQYPHLTYKTVLWEGLYDAFSRIPNPSAPLSELLVFMQKQGLSPMPPVTEDQLKSFMRGRGILGRLTHYAAKLRDEGDWSHIPQRYRTRPSVTDKWGRIGVEFASPGWNPTLTIGFLYDSFDHKVPIIKSDESPDLILRIEAERAKNPNPAVAVDALRKKVSALQQPGVQIHLHGDRGNNHNSLLIVQRSLSDVIRGYQTEQDHISAIYDQAKAWTLALFNDGELEPSLLTLK